MLIEWPRSHYGYRQQDVQEIVRLLDSAIARLQGGAPPPPFQIALVSAPEMALEPLATMPSPREQLEQLLRICDGHHRRERSGGAAAIRAHAAGDARRHHRFRGEPACVVCREPDRARGGDRPALSAGQQGPAGRARHARPANADIRNVERVLERIPKEDARLGEQRPEVVQALTASVQSQLDNARRLRLLRDQWSSRQALFREYQRSVGMDLVQLVKARPALESIKKLDGPPPDRLDSLNRVLRGGAHRLDRLLVPEYLRSTHEMVIGAWRFAETAAAARPQARSRPATSRSPGKRRPRPPAR